LKSVCSAGNEYGQAHVVM